MREELERLTAASVAICAVLDGEIEDGPAEMTIEAEFREAIAFATLALSTEAA